MNLNEQNVKRKRTMEDVTFTTAAAAPQTNEQRLVALERELAEAKGELTDATAALKKWSELLEKAILGEEEHKENKAEYREQQDKYKEERNIYLDRVRDLEGQIAGYRSEVSKKLKLEIPRLQNPLPPPETKEVFPFIESEGSKKIEDKLFKFASKELPTKDLRELQYCLVRGAMGVGKTTTTYRAVTSVCPKLPACIPCYVRLDALQARLRMNSVEEDIDPTILLAAALLYGFTQESLAVYGPSLHDVAKKIREDLGVVKVILHLDEFQSQPILARKIMGGCKLSLISSSYTVCVVPILSGVNDLNQIAEPLSPSNWSGDEVQLGRLPMDELEKRK